MKKNIIKITLFLLTILPLSLLSQSENTSTINQYPVDNAFNLSIDRQLRYKNDKDIDDKVVDALKNTTTILFLNLNNGDTVLENKYKKAISQVWDLSPIEIVPYTEIGNYLNSPDYSLIMIEGVYSELGTKLTATGDYYLTLTVNALNKKKTKVNTYILGRIDLFPTLNKDNYQKIKHPFLNFKGSDVEVSNEIYDLAKNGYIFNLNPVNIMAHLSVISNNIKKNIRPDHEKTIESKKMIEKLSNDTLYIPKRILKKYKSTGLNSFVELDADESLLSKYKYNYRICTDDELYDIFVNKKRGNLLFEYVYSDRKYINIIDVKNGEYLFKKQFSIHNSDLEESDFKKISN